LHSNTGSKGEFRGGKRSERNVWWMWRLLLQPVTFSQVRERVECALDADRRIELKSIRPRHFVLYTNICIKSWEGPAGCAASSVNAAIIATCTSFRWLRAEFESHPHAFSVVNDALLLAQKIQVSVMG